MPLNFRKSRNLPSINSIGLTTGSFSYGENSFGGFTSSRSRDSFDCGQVKNHNNDQKRRYSPNNYEFQKRIPRILPKIVRGIINSGFLAKFEAFMVLLGSSILLIHLKHMGTPSIASRAEIMAAKASIHVPHPLRITIRQRPDDSKVINLHLSSIPSTVFQSAPQAFFVSPNPKYDLNINFLTEDSKPWGRRLKINEEELMGGHVYNESDYEHDWRSYEKYYAFDDDIVRNEWFEDEENHCRRVSWHRLYNPSCNTIHEFELLPSRNKMNKNKLLGEGSYRAAFFLGDVHDPQLVMKLQRFALNYKTDVYEFVRMDALVMERLTGSPRIVDVYGHCATSVITEFLPKELNDVTIPLKSRRKQMNKILEQKQKGMKVRPLNNLTMTERLDFAIEMAEAIADIHGFKDGVLIHDDIQLVQFLFTKDGKLKLNDFNRGEAMLFNEKKNDYCRYRNGPGGGDWRAPEEYADEPLDEKIDVWSFGNNVFSLLTGLYVFYEERSFKKIKKMVLNGERQNIDEAYRSGNHIERKLVEVIEKCWTTVPNERPSIFEIIDDLKRIKTSVFE